MPQDEETSYLTMRQVAGIMSVSKTRVRELIRKGLIGGAFRHTGPMGTYYLIRPLPDGTIDVRRGPRGPKSRYLASRSHEG